MHENLVIRIVEYGMAQKLNPTTRKKGSNPVDKSTRKAQDRIENGKHHALSFEKEKKRFYNHGYARLSRLNLSGEEKRKDARRH
jgi:hypothetical protein